MNSLWVGNEVVTEQQPVPMLSERATASDHVYVVSAHAALVAPNEEGVPRWNVIAECGPPEVIIPLCLKNRRNLKAGGAERVNLHEQVYDWLGGKSWDSRAAEVLDTANEPGRQEGAQMLGLLTEKLGPTRIVRDNRDIFTNGSLHAVFKGFHFAKAVRVA